MTVKTTAKRTTASKNTTSARTRKAPKTLGIKVSTWKAIGNFLTSRSRDLALIAIVGAAFVAVFEGSLYSATKFGFTGWSAVAFAIMPDALMVLSAAKMRQVGITAAQHRVAKVSMYYGLVFSLFTNMIAAFLKYAPQAMITPLFLLIGAIAYHGVVVIFLWRAVETLTKTRADRRDAKAPKASAVVTETPAQVNPLPPILIKPMDWTATSLARLTGAHRSN